MKKALSLLVLVSSFSFAATEPKESLLKPVATRVMLNEMVSVKPLDGYHLNLKAPHDCGGAEQVSASPFEFICQATVGPAFTARIGVCDDKESFCKIESVTVQVDGAPTRAAPARLALPVAKRKELVNGFIDNDWARAVKEAAKRKQPLLVDVYAQWCPPCNELDELVFSSKEFATASRGFVKVRVDADVASAWDFRERYRIQGLPTTLILTADKQEEVSRMVGFKSLAYVNRWLPKQLAMAKSPVLAINATSSEEAQLRAAQWRIDRGEPALAQELLRGKSSPAAKLMLLRADLRIAELAEDKKAQAVALDALLNEFPDELSATYWIQGLYGLDAALAKKHLDAVFKNLAAWRADPAKLDAQDSDIDLASLWEAEGDLRGLLKEDKKKQEAYAQAVIALDARPSDAPEKLSKGTNMRKASALLEAGRNAEALVLLKKLVETYPDEYPFNQIYARALLKLDRPAEALPYVNRSEALGFGDNWLRAVHLKAKVLAALGRKDEALALIDKTLGDVKLPKSQAAWTHYRVADLRELRQTIAQTNGQANGQTNGQTSGKTK